MHIVTEVSIYKPPARVRAVTGVYIAHRDRCPRQWALTVVSILHFVTEVSIYIYMCVYICLYMGAAGAGAVVGSGDGGALAFVGVYVHIQTEISVYV